jgi:hypothetical protein
MDEEERRHLIEDYISAYNAFDIDGMMSLVHPDIEFRNLVSGQVNATASGRSEFRQMAEQSKTMFTSRKQTMTGFTSKEEQVFIEISYEGVLASDLPNGMKSGETLRLIGRSEFAFRDGKIFRITDMS